MRVAITVDAGRRMVVNEMGGFDLEALVPGIGWVLDNDADVADSVLEGHLTAAIGALCKANGNLGGCSLEEVDGNDHNVKAVAS